MRIVEMTVINCILGVPLGIVALLFVFIGWRRGIRFRLHDYDGDKKERLRDNFFSSFAMITGISCFLPILAPTNLWGLVIPFSLLLILAVTPLAMLGASAASFLFRLPKHSTFNVGLWGPSNTDGSILQWYEYAPCALIVGWIVCYIVYVAASVTLGIRIMSDNVPAWIILVALSFGVIATLILTIGIRRKFERQ